MPPKTKQKPNKVKMDKERPFTDCDEQLKHELKAFRGKIHAELWGDITDILFGPHIFLTEPQIFHLCYLAHANALHTLKDLKNNFQWNWMSDYGHYLNSYTVLTPLSCPLLFQSKMGLASQMPRSWTTKCLPSHQGVVRKESRRDPATNVAAPVVHLAIIVSFVSKYLFPLIN